MERRQCEGMSNKSNGMYVKKKKKRNGGEEEEEEEVIISDLFR